MRERYAQVGISFDFKPTLSGASLGLLDGTLEDNEIPAFDGATGKIFFPQATKDLIDHGPPNDLHNTLMIYLVNGLGTSGNAHNGVATPPNYVWAADVRFRNKVLLADQRYRDFTAAHEALHVLADAVHSAAPYNDFSTEYGNQNTIWTVPPSFPSNEMNRRDNSSIGATKRISVAQELQIQSSPLAK